MDPSELAVYGEFEEASYAGASPGSIDDLWKRLQNERAIRLQPQISPQQIPFNNILSEYNAPAADPSDQVSDDQSSSSPHNLLEQADVEHGAQHALQLYQMRLMLLEQQNRERRWAAGSYQASTPVLNALQDFELQLKLLEQQNKKRLQAARVHQASQQMSSETSWTKYNAPVFSQRNVTSPLSNFASPASFMSGSSPASFMTARSSHASPTFSSAYGLSPAVRIQTIREDEICDPNMPAPLQKVRNDYYVHLHEQNIIQPFDKELNWSGKGQHVTFMPKDNVPLSVLSHLGASATAKVDKVLCKRIALAKKTMRCSRMWTVSEALTEVCHLQVLQHRHIVQLVGTYLQGRDFSVLMYPAADCHLGTFLEDTADMCTEDFPAPESMEIHPTPYNRRLTWLAKSFGCLTSALAYVHDHATKHMDIKPQNILVREISAGEYRAYLADFGLSRSFVSQGHSQTDGPTSLTARYCAPEVFQYSMRGRSADIFSLGCVFSQISTVLGGKHPHDFADHRRGDSQDDSFHSSLDRVYTWLDDIPLSLNITNNRLCLNYLGLYIHDATNLGSSIRGLITRMLDRDPKARPTSSIILHQLTDLYRPSGFSLSKCCNLPPEDYVAHDDTGAEC